MPIAGKRQRNCVGCAISHTGVLWFWVCLLVVLFYVNTACSADEAHSYREVTGNSVKEATWRLTRSDTCRLSYSLPGVLHLTTTDANYNTLKWEVNNSGEQTELTAERKENRIRIRGRYNGQPLDKEIKIDASPWYQATSLSLRKLVISPATEQVFWTIRLKTMTAHKLRADKKKIELDEDGNKLQHIRLRAAGMLAPFWKSDYWYDLPQGVLFRFKGPSGPPGSPMTTVTRIGDIDPKTSSVSGSLTEIYPSSNTGH